MRLLSVYGFLIALCVIGVSLVSCKSSGDPSTSLIIESITPTGFVGMPGDDVQFSAVVTGIVGTPTYVWEFDGGATPNTSREATPTVDLGSAETYTGSLSIYFQGEGATMPFTFQVVDVPVVQSVTPTGSAGLPLGVVQFSADVLGDPTSFAWTFEDGALPATSADEEPEVILQDSGTYTGNLVAINAQGDSKAFPFSFTVDAPVAPSWTIVKVRSESADSAPNLQVVNDRLVLTYNMTQTIAPDSNAIRYTVATSAMPTSEADFQSHSVIAESLDFHPRLSGRQSTGFAEDGTPYLVFGTNTSAPRITKLARGLSASPASIADWDITDVQVGRGTNSNGALILVRRDKIWVLVPDSASFFLYMANTLEPTGASDWNSHFAVDGVGGGFSWPSMQEINNRLHITASHSGNQTLSSISHFVSLVETPAAEAEWKGMTLDIRDVGWTQAPVLTEWEGKPLVFAPASPGLLHVALLYFASTPDPSRLSDFNRVQISPPGLRTSGLGLTITGNRLAALYRDLDQSRPGILRQVGTDAQDPTKWEKSEFGPVGSDFPLATAITVLDDRIVVAFIDPVDHHLTVAIADGLY